MYQQQYGIPYPQPFQQPRRLEFVDGEAGMQAYQVGPGEVVPLFDTGSATMWLKSANSAGVPSTIRYRLTEEEQSVAATGTEARLEAIERSIEQIREALDADTVPDVRRQPRHAAAAGDGGGA